MRAAVYRHKGSARDVLRIEDLPRPEPAPGEVRVRVACSGVNPSDVKSRLKRPLNAELVVPHSDGAGVIDAVGAGVSEARLGERVWIWNGQWQRALGTAADYIALPAAQAVRLPANTSFQAGACFGVWNLVAKLNLALAAGLALPLLALLGYVPGSGEGLASLTFAYALLPLGFKALAGLLLWRWRRSLEI